VGEGTKIEWADHTFNPWWGCQRVSPGCEHCYAETFAKRVGLKVWGPSAKRRFFGDAHWAKPFKWNAAAERDGVRRRVFCASMADVFEDGPHLTHERSVLWRLMKNTPHLDWLLLTKRPENVERLVADAVAHAREFNPDETPAWSPNVWLGVTAENQEYADRRIPTLLGIKGPAVRFVSYEPALGHVDFARYLYPIFVVTPRWRRNELLTPALDWIIVGGESGPKARHFNPTWARDVVDGCRAAGVACFVKQLGANVLDFSGMLRDRKGGDWSEWPTDLRIRQFPERART